MEVDPGAVTESGGVLAGAEGSWGGPMTLPSNVLLRGIRQETGGSSQPAFILKSKSVITSGFHTYGTDNAHQNLAVETGGIDLADCAMSLTAPRVTISSLSPLKLYNGAAYIYPEKRTLLLDLAGKTGSGADQKMKRFEVRIEIKGVTRSTLDVTVTKTATITLTPGVKPKAYSTGMVLTNNEAYPIQFGITSVKEKELSDSIDVKLTPIDNSYVIDNSVPIPGADQQVNDVYKSQPMEGYRYEPF